MQPDNQNFNQIDQTVPQPQQANLGVAPQQPPVIASGAPDPNQPGPQTTPQNQPAKPVDNTAQNSLLFSEMRDNMIVMNDGSFRAVVQCQSINFDLMSSREREGVEYSYQNFLNSLYFPVQILVRSRRVDISPYIDRLLDIRRSQDNMLLNVLMDDYINFIDNLSQEANIMDKSFYVVVPYYPLGDLVEIKKQAKGLFDSLFGGNKQQNVVTVDQITYDKAKEEIKNRVDSVMNGLFQLGIQSKQLSTYDLGDLFYRSYNHETASRQPLNGLRQDDLASMYVKKGEGDHMSVGGSY